MLKSVGVRYLIVGLLVLFMCVPLILVSGVVKERKYYSEQTTRELSAEWGGAQVLNAPVIMMPVTEKVQETIKQTLKDPNTNEILLTKDGITRYRLVTKTVTKQRDPIYLLPDRMDHTLTSETDIRKRGIFEVPVYSGMSRQTFNFDFLQVTKVLKGDETVDWQGAKFLFGVSQNRALRGAINLQADGKEINLEPRDRTSGLFADLGDPRKIKQFNLSLDFLGAQSLHTVAAGKENSITLKGDWPHPSFDGAFLPDGRKVSSDGFEAHYGVGHFARPIPQISRANPESAMLKTAQLGLRFYQPNDFYQQAYRAGRYGVLFIGLTFLTILLLETKGRPVHPVQYLMVGLAQSMFVMLMVAFAEQVGFTAAYAIASAATIGLITLYSFLGLKIGRRGWVVGGALTVLYGVLYFILQSADYALLAGTVLCFGAIAAAMMATRNEDWYGRMSELVPSRKPKPTQQVS